MGDADLGKPFWMPLMAGWTTAAEGFEFTRTHDWSEFMQLRIHMERDEPVPSAGATRAYLNRILQFFPLFPDREAAAGREFTAVMVFREAGVGAFTIRVSDGNASVTTGEVENADLVMTQSAERLKKLSAASKNRPRPWVPARSRSATSKGWLCLASFSQWDRPSAAPDPGQSVPLKLK